MTSIILKTSFRILTKCSALRNQIQKFQTNIIQCSFATVTTRCVSSSLSSDEYKSAEINLGPEANQKYASALRLNHNRLQNMLLISTTDAKDLIKCYPKLKTCSAILSQMNLQLYINAGIDRELISKYPMLLTVEHLDKRIQYIKRLKTDLKLIAPLLLAKQFFKIVDHAKLEESIVPFGNRILYLSHMFNVSRLSIQDII